MVLNDQIRDLQNLRPDATGYLDWRPYMEKYHCDAICEIGIRRGGNFKNLIKHGPKLAVAVDCWTASGTIAQNESRYSQKQLDEQYSNFKAELADKPFVKVCRGFSYDEVREFADGTFDLIFIDGDHTYIGCLRDITDWYPKLKKGGVLLGDDYKKRVARTRAGRIVYGVIEAVDEFAKDNNLALFSLFPEGYWGMIKN